MISRALKRPQSPLLRYQAVPEPTKIPVPARKKKRQHDSSAEMCREGKPRKRTERAAQSDEGQVPRFQCPTRVHSGRLAYPD